jgi:putative transposase
MPNYRRHFQPGGTYYFTAALADRHETTLVSQIERLRNAWRRVSLQLPFQTVAVCVLPELIHAVWTLPPGDSNYPERWRRIKHDFSIGLPVSEKLSSSQHFKHEKGIWQRRFWEHFIRDEDDFERVINYIYFNPVKHGWCESVKDWRYSSFHRDVAAGLFPQSWGGISITDFPKEMGEPV